MTTNESKEAAAEQFVPAEKYDALKQDYNKFAYIVSHDINAPLRHIREFTKILLGELEPHIEGENKELADVILRNVDKAEGLINCLVQYSRLNTQIQPFEQINTTALVGDVLSTLSQEIRRIGGDVQVRDLSNLIGYERQISRLFQCLIDNALKFRRDDVPLEILISGEAGDDGIIITVEDNGLGVPENRLEKIFDLFDRQHIEGNDGFGLGLTLCKRIVWLHDGSIKMESVVGEGSKVIVSLPKQD